MKLQGIAKSERPPPLQKIDKCGGDGEELILGLYKNSQFKMLHNIRKILQNIFKLSQFFLFFLLPVHE